MCVEKIACPRNCNCSSDVWPDHAVIIINASGTLSKPLNMEDCFCGLVAVCQDDRRFRTEPQAQLDAIAAAISGRIVRFIFRYLCIQSAIKAEKRK